MKTNRWLIVIILISWTLNVGFGVAFFLKNKYPEGAFFPTPPPPPSGEMIGEFGGKMHHDFREIIMPMKQEQNMLIMDLVQLMSEDTLDSARIKTLSDTLAGLNGQIQQKQIEFLIKMHDQLPPPHRRELVARMSHRFGGKDCNWDVNRSEHRKKWRNVEKRHKDFINSTQ